MAPPSSPGTAPAAGASKPKGKKRKVRIRGEKPRYLKVWRQEERAPEVRLGRGRTRPLDILPKASADNAIPRKFRELMAAKAALGEKEARKKEKRGGGVGVGAKAGPAVVVTSRTTDTGIHGGKSAGNDTGKATGKDGGKGDKAKKKKGAGVKDVGIVKPGKKASEKRQSAREIVIESTRMNSHQHAKKKAFHARREERAAERKEKAKKRRRRARRGDDVSDTDSDVEEDGESDDGEWEKEKMERFRRRRRDAADEKAPVVRGFGAKAQAQAPPKLQTVVTRHRQRK